MFHATHQEQRCPGYCDCRFPSCIEVTHHQGHIPDLVKCRCGEDTGQELQWQWHKGDDSNAQTNGRDIIFHPNYSQGTAIVRGEQPLEPAKVHFWEMRVITPLAGTDVMFGVGTQSVNLEQFKYHFVSALGTNAQSWGYSYNGKKQHCGEQLPYGQKFSQGCLVGIYLDRTRGHLEFYLNRRALGVAYTNIPTDAAVKIYPMVCSTAAKSVIRLISSTAQADTLQLRAFQVLAKQTQTQQLEQLRHMPGLQHILKAYWFLAPPVRYSRSSQENELDLDDEAVLSAAQLRLRRKQKFTDTDTEPDIDDLYANAHKITLRCQDNNSGDEEYCPSIHEFYDEFFHNFH